MRNGINGLSRIVRDEMGLAPLGGGIFVFFSKNRQSVKLLRWDSDGFSPYHKRLERGTFEAPSINESTGRAEMPWRTFSLIMQGISTNSVKYRSGCILMFRGRCNLLITNKIFVKYQPESFVIT